MSRSSHRFPDRVTCKDSPSGSGVTIIDQLGELFQIAEEYDILGFDPRGLLVTHFPGSCSNNSV